MEPPVIVDTSPDYFQFAAQQYPVGSQDIEEFALRHVCFCIRRLASDRLIGTAALFINRGKVSYQFSLLFLSGVSRHKGIVEADESRI